MRYKHIQADSAEKYNIEGGEMISILASAQEQIIEYPFLIADCLRAMKPPGTLS